MLRVYLWLAVCNLHIGGPRVEFDSVMFVFLSSKTELLLLFDYYMFYSVKVSLDGVRHMVNVSFSIAVIL